MSDSIACLRHCGRVAFVRGLCPGCRRALVRAVARGETTEAAEVAAGRLLAAKKHGPAFGTLFK